MPLIIGRFVAALAAVSTPRVLETPSDCLTGSVLTLVQGCDLTGRLPYYGITGNARSLGCFDRLVQRIWLKWLNRRGGHRLNWAGSARLLARYPLPTARVVHSVYHVAKTAS